MRAGAPFFQKQRLLVCLCSVLLAGCGEGRDLVTVEGTVTLDGQPLPDVQVLFYVPNAGPEMNFIGQTDAQGHYTLTTIRKEQTGIAPGKYTVALTTAFAGPSMTETDPLPPELIPPDSRRLDYEVPPGGTQEADFALTSP